MLVSLDLSDPAKGSYLQTEALTTDTLAFRCTWGWSSSWVSIQLLYALAICRKSLKPNKKCICLKGSWLPPNLHRLNVTVTDGNVFHVYSLPTCVAYDACITSFFIFLCLYPMPRYERSWDKSNKTKLLQDGLERAGRRDLAERLRCRHWGHQKLSCKVELPSAFPYIITVHKTMNNKEGLRRINDLNPSYN